MSFWSRHYFYLTPLEWAFVLALIVLFASFEDCARGPRRQPRAAPVEQPKSTDHRLLEVLLAKLRRDE